jgi:5-methyltetrahydrofolate--homocysteine methyltransferase
VHYSGTPELMAAYARLAIDAGARIVGGCCGTTAAHLAAMRAAIDQHSRGAPPDRIKIEAQMGPLASPPPKTRARERRGRRGGEALPG